MADEKSQESLVVYRILIVPKTMQESIHCSPILTGDDLDFSEYVLFKIVQNDDYSKAIKSLISTGVVSRKSSIYNLNSILHEKGVLILAGILNAAPTIVNEKLHQLIFPSREHHITNLLINGLHRKFHHLNKEFVVNELRQQ